MLRQLTYWTTDQLLQKNIIKKEDYEIYQFGTEVIFSTVVNTAIVLMLGMILGFLFETVVFLIAFAVLRTYAGGYHAKSHWGCIISFVTMYGVCMLIVKFLPLEYVSIFSCILSGISLIAVLKLAPIEHPNRPFEGNEFKVYRFFAVGIAIFEVGLIVLFLVLIPGLAKISLILSLAMVCVTGILIFEKLKRTKV